MLREILEQIPANYGLIIDDVPHKSGRRRLPRAVEWPAFEQLSRVATPFTLCSVNLVESLKAHRNDENFQWNCHTRLRRCCPEPRTGYELN